MLSLESVVGLPILWWPLDELLAVVQDNLVPLAEAINYWQVKIKFSVHSSAFSLHTASLLHTFTVEVSTVLLAVNDIFSNNLHKQRCAGKWLTIRSPKMCVYIFVKKIADMKDV